jgi:hypothetical protein
MAELGDLPVTFLWEEEPARMDVQVRVGRCLATDKRMVWVYFVSFLLEREQAFIRYEEEFRQTPTRRPFSNRDAFMTFYDNRRREAPQVECNCSKCGPLSPEQKVRPYSVDQQVDQTFWSFWSDPRPTFSGSLATVVEVQVTHLTSDEIRQRKSRELQQARHEGAVQQNVEMLEHEKEIQRAVEWLYTSRQAQQRFMMIRISRAGDIEGTPETGFEVTGAAGDTAHAEEIFQRPNTFR